MKLISFVSKFRKRYRKKTRHIGKVLKQKWCLKYFTLSNDFVNFLERNVSREQDKTEATFKNKNYDFEITLDYSFSQNQEPLQSQITLTNSMQEGEVLVQAKIWGEIRVQLQISTLV